MFFPDANGRPSAMKLIPDLCAARGQPIDLDKIESVLVVAVRKPLEAVGEPQIFVDIPVWHRRVHTERAREPRYCFENPQVPPIRGVSWA